MYNQPTICLKWYPYSNYSQNLLYFAHVNGFIGIIDKTSLKRKLLIEEPDEIACIDFSSDSSCLASVGKDAKIRLYDTNLNNTNTASHRLLITYGGSNNDNYSSQSGLNNSNNSSSNNTFHTNRLQCVKFSNKTNDILLSGGWDRTVKIWDRRVANGVVYTIHGPFICGSDAIDINVSESFSDYQERI